MTPMTISIFTNKGAQTSWEQNTAAKYYSLRTETSYKETEIKSWSSLADMKITLLLGTEK